jgi:hypothetical protein
LGHFADDQKNKDEIKSYENGVVDYPANYTFTKAGNLIVYVNILRCVYGYGLHLNKDIFVDVNYDCILKICEYFNKK